MSESLYSASRPLEPLLDALLDNTPQPVNQNIARRAEVYAQDRHWQPTRIAGLSMCILEYLNVANPRMTALLKLDPETDSVEIPASDLELLLEHGMLADDQTEYLHPFYIRQPHERFGINQTFTLYPGSRSKQPGENQLEFYVATGQIAVTDKQRRCINLADHSLWLPGPVEHTEVMPLHMHDGNNSMLVRWLDTTSFRPRLDPMGEEVLVINGTLADDKGTYSAGSWIRNPVTTWQAWSGQAGTLIYYKNGHFGSAPD